MKFPISRESLLTSDINKEYEEKLLQEKVELFCKEFERSFLSNINKKQFVFNNLNSMKMIYYNMNGGTNTLAKNILPKFIEKLKETFIDPLETYIIIDWS